MNPSLEPNLASFVIRFIPETDGNQTRWRGRIRHVQSEEEIAFVHLSQALRFMHKQVAVGDSPGDLELHTMFHGLELEKENKGWTLSWTADEMSKLEGKMDISRLLQRQARYRPNHTAVIFEDYRLTYLEFNRRVNRLANALGSMGIKKGLTTRQRGVSE